MAKELSTEPYKGTRDFYPEDMAVQRYIFETWSKTAERFGYARYDASILEPAELYRSKNSENEEIVNEQTYTFVDRGEREVTLRPEMTPTVARMVAARRRDLTFPVRWYSIPNLFRYERPQRGRLREHWQLNCDLFGVDDVAADVEMIALAYQVLIDFGATPDMFMIRVNDRAWLNAFLEAEGLPESKQKAMLALLDRKEKIDTFDAEAAEIMGKPFVLPTQAPSESTISRVIDSLNALGIQNVQFAPSTVRGFSYYTGTVFEIFDTDPKNNRSLIGGGRYDNLTSLFGGDPIAGIGFGMGDVTMRDFLLTHKLPTQRDPKIFDLALLPMSPQYNVTAEKFAQQLRALQISCYTDLSDRKIGKKVDTFLKRTDTRMFCQIGENELSSGTLNISNKLYTVTELAEKIKAERHAADIVIRYSRNTGMQ